MRKKLNDIFDSDSIYSNHDDCLDFTYDHYLNQVVENGQLSSFRETIEEIETDDLIDFLISGVALREIYIESVKNEIVSREIKKCPYCGTTEMLCGHNGVGCLVEEERENSR